LIFQRNTSLFKERCFVSVFAAQTCFQSVNQRFLKFCSS